MGYKQITFSIVIFFLGRVWWKGPVLDLGFSLSFVYIFWGWLISGQRSKLFWIIWGLFSITGIFHIFWSASFYHSPCIAEDFLHITPFPFLIYCLATGKICKLLLKYLTDVSSETSHESCWTQASEGFSPLKSYRNKSFPVSAESQD